MLIKDTHKAIKSLKEAGLPPEQAERIVGLFQEADEQAATGHDIDLLRKDIEALRKEVHDEIDSLRKEMHDEIGSLRKEMHGEIGSLRKEMRGEIGSLRKEMRGEIGSLRKEMNSEMGSLRKEMDVLRKDLTIKVYTVGLAIAGLMAALELL